MTLRQQKILQAAIECATEVYGVDPLAKNKIGVTPWARAAIYNELKKAGMNITNIGKVTNMDHSTVSHWTRGKHKDNLLFDKKYRELHDQFRRLLSLVIDEEEMYVEDLKTVAIRIKKQLFEMGFDKVRQDEFWQEAIENNNNKSA